MENKILKQLSKRPYIHGITQFYFMDRWLGRKDFKNAQLCVRDGDYETPRILEKVRGLSEYIHKMYCQVDKALEPIAHAVAGEIQELDFLKTGNVPNGLDAENMERMQASIGSQAVAMEQRKKEILIHLNETKMDIDTIDAALNHHFQRAEGMLLKHVSSYWSGILKEAAASDMPAAPEVKIQNIEGKQVYEKHIGSIRECLNKVLLT